MGGIGPAAVGALIGLGASAGWWYGFACTACGAGASPVGVFVFSTLVGALTARRFARDYAPPEPR
jgi:hypothetical protein